MASKNNNLKAKKPPSNGAEEALKAAGWTEAEVKEALADSPKIEPSQPVVAIESAATVVTDMSTSKHSNGVLVAVFITAVFLLCAVGVATIIKTTKQRSFKTAGTISSQSCLRENGVIGGSVNARVCQIGTVKLTIID